jgi:hypothetical protein
MSVLRFYCDAGFEVLAEEVDAHGGGAEDGRRNGEESFHVEMRLGWVKKMEYCESGRSSYGLNRTGYGSANVTSPNTRSGCRHDPLTFLTLLLRWR